MSPTVHTTTRDVVVIEGPDATGYLQGQLSQDIGALPVGGVTWSFVLAPQGKVEGWGRVRRTGTETVEIDADPGAGGQWVARLERFLLRTKATISLRPGVAMVAVRGVTLEGEGWLDAGWPGSAGVDRLGSPDRTDVPADAVDLDAAGYDALRIAAGVPVWGREIDADTIPAALGAAVNGASVSFTKGCYTGQELVARMDARGNLAPRRLAFVSLTGEAPAPGAVVVVGGGDAGHVTSSAPLAGGAIALALVDRSVDLPADGIVDGIPVHLADLPS